jgi:AraC-like DNA-binding protein
MSKIQTTRRLRDLLKEVENTLRCNISTSSNCNQLSREILNKTSCYLSPQTLRRVFGLVKTKSLPSHFTLDTLCKYCGYQDWSQFATEKKRTTGTSAPKETFSKWILDFYQSPALNVWPSIDYFFACRNIAERIVSDKALYRALPPQLASMPSGQILFFECFPYIDGLGNGYQKHLQVYLHNKRDNWEAQVFANCLLFLGAYLTKSDKQIKYYYSVINSIKCPVPGDIHPLPTARYVGVQILYHHYVGNYEVTMQWLNKGVHEYIRLYTTTLQKVFDVNYYFILSEHLFLAGLYTNCSELVGTFINRKWKNYYTPEFSYYSEAQLILAISNIKLGNPVGKQQFKSVDLSSFVFTKSKLYTLHYLSQQLDSSGPKAVAKRRKIIQQIKRLVKDTGFVYFSHLK